MPMTDVNLFAVLGATVAGQIIGALWYSRFLFGRGWPGAPGTGDEQARQVIPHVGSFVSALIMAFVLAHFVAANLADTAAQGAETGFWIWFGFVLTTRAVHDFLSGRPKELFLIDSGLYLVVLVVMGAILAVWV
jgi:hypothetical protein